MVPHQVEQSAHLSRGICRLLVCLHRAECKRYTSVLE
jgi:hypothetical protein